MFVIPLPAPPGWVAVLPNTYHDSWKPHTEGMAFESPMKYYSKKRGIHYKVAGVRLLFTVFASWRVCLSGNDDFPLAKVECLPGDGKYRPSRDYFARQFPESLPVLCQNGYSQNSQTKFLALHLEPWHSLSRAKKKSIPDKDMGIKKAHRLKNRTKE